MKNLSPLSLEAPPRAAAHPVALHSVRKPPAKQSKKAEPPPPKVYRVDPRGFRKLVQRLTGSQSQSQSVHRPLSLRETVAPPPPLDLAPRTAPPPLPLPRPVFAPGSVGQLQCPVAGHQSPAGMIGYLSPSLYSPWCSFPLLSPGTMASLDSSPAPAAI